MLSLVLLPKVAQSQVKLAPDTLECHIVSFSVGLLTPGSGSNSQGLAGGNMADLYGKPYLDFALEWGYKFHDGWMPELDADFWMGISGDNLLQRGERMGSVFSYGNYAMCWGGYDGQVMAYNRGLAVVPTIGRIVRVLPKNPNSGILFKVGAGWMTQKTIFTQDYTQSPVPQINGDYGKLYDHMRGGIRLMQGIGFVFMSNLSTYVNFKLTLEISECWTWSSRPYQIDNLMGLNGKDGSRYFDLLYGVRLTWMFPFTGKTTYDYYYY